VRRVLGCDVRLGSGREWYVKGCEGTDEGMSGKCSRKRGAESQIAKLECFLVCF